MIGDLLATIPVAAFGLATERLEANNVATVARCGRRLRASTRPAPVAAAAVADAALKRDRRARLALTMISSGEGRVAARLEEFPY